TPTSLEVASCWTNHAQNAAMLRPESSLVTARRSQLGHDKRTPSLLPTSSEAPAPQPVRSPHDLPDRCGAVSSPPSKSGYLPARAVPALGGSGRRSPCHQTPRESRPLPPQTRIPVLFFRKSHATTASGEETAKKDAP